MHYFKRHWNERRGDAHDDWGTSTWYFETDAAMCPTRQLEVYANGKVLRYDRQHIEDEFGGMPKKPILIAEDFEPDAKLLELALKTAGVVNPLVFVMNGDEVLCYLKGEGIFSDRQANPLPRIVLLDLNMPRVGGYEVIQWIRSQLRFREFVVVVFGVAKVGKHSFPVAPRMFSDEVKYNLNFAFRFWTELHRSPVCELVSGLLNGGH